MLPTNDEDSIKKGIKDVLADLQKDNSDDPNRINYTLTRVEAMLDNRSRRTESRVEADLAATRQELSETHQKLDKMMVLLQQVFEKVDA
jgi:hypothetical protein